MITPLLSSAALAQISVTAAHVHSTRVSVEEITPAARPHADGADPVQPSLGGNRPVDGKTLLALQETSTDARGLTKEEQEIVAEMKKRDMEVRRHEQAHSAAAGPYGGMPSYEYQRGPDGQMYAVSGEVSIDVSPESNPAATIDKMETVIRAALAPIDPSAQDRAVAAQARKALSDAQADLKEEKAEEAERSKQKAEERQSGAPAGEASTTDVTKATDAYRQTSILISQLTAQRESPRNEFLVPSHTAKSPPRNDISEIFA